MKNTISIALALCSFTTALASQEAPRWHAVPDGSTGRAQFLYGGGAAPRFAPQTEADCELLAREFLAATRDQHGVAPATLVLDDVRFLPLGQIGASDKWAVRYRQEIDGIPVVSGALSVLLDTTGQPLSLQTMALPDTEHLAQARALSPGAARTRAAALFSERKGVHANHIGDAKLVVDQVIVPGGRVPVLAWEVELLSEREGENPEGELLRIDARTGDLSSTEETVHHLDVTGTVSTYATPGVAPDIDSNGPVLKTVPHVYVTCDQGTETTDENGDFTFGGVNTITNVEIRYVGDWATVDSDWIAPDHVTELATFSTGDPDPVMNSPLGMVPSEQSYQTAEANAYMALNEMRAWLLDVDPGDDTWDFQAWALVNKIGNCQAGKFSVNGPRVSFERGGGGNCHHGGYSTWIAHEMGHWLTLLYGNGGGFGLGEGTADVFAMYLYDTPDVGLDYYAEGDGAVRSGMNNKQFCGFDDGQLIQDCHGAYSHPNGEVFMGAAWKVRRNLKLTHGAVVGGMVADELFLSWMKGYNQFQIHPVIEKQWLLLDDDDGNICTPSPNWDDIRDGFAEHGLTATLPPACGAINGWIGIEPGGDENGPYLTSIDIDPPVGGIALATVYYRVSGGAWQSTSLAPSTTTGSSTWEGYVPGQVSPAYIEYYYEVLDAAGGALRFPAEAPGELLMAEVGTLVDIWRDDFEVPKAWTVENDTSLTSGAWERVNPIGSDAAPEDAFEGTHCYVTGQNTLGGEDEDDDVDGGPTRLISPEIDLRGLDAHISFQRWTMNPQADSDDCLIWDITTDGGSTWFPLGDWGGSDDGQWNAEEHFLEGLVGPTGAPATKVQFRFSAMERGDASLLECAIDDFRVSVLAPSGGCIDTSNYCDLSANSVGPGASMSTTGTPSVLANGLVLHAGPCPAGQPGLFFYGSAQIDVPFGNGRRCAGGSVFRLNPPVLVAATGTASKALDLLSAPANAGAGQIDPGSQWNFQFWYRDPAGGGAGFNLSDALNVIFCP